MKFWKSNHSVALKFVIQYPHLAENVFLDLLKLLGETFQFYLAFENSLCDDYITEKFFNCLLANAEIIPVVMNGANMSSIAPKNSYIDVKDFETIAGERYCSKRSS